MATVDLYKCGCQWEEIGNQVKESPVMGYALKIECAGCATKRAESAVNMAKLKETQDRQQKIAQRAQEDAWKKAEEDLKKEGKL
jgi:hypothetical protein